MFKKLAFSAVAAALLGGTALAQTAPADPAAPMTPPAADPAMSAPADPAMAPADPGMAPADPAMAAPPPADPAMAQPMADPAAPAPAASGAMASGMTPPASYPPCRGNVRDSCDQSATSESRAATAAEAMASGGVGDRNRDQAAMMRGGKKAMRRKPRG